MPLPVPMPKPAIQAPPSSTPAPAPSLADAEDAFLLAFDAGTEAPPAPELSAPDRAAYEWLQRAAAWKTGAAPVSPFPKGSAADREAQAWRAFLASGKGQPAQLPVGLSGSRVLLWSWLRERERHGPLPEAQRRRLEDRLLAGGPAVIRGWALRHALCFTVAERSLARFSALKAHYGADATDTFSSIQALFGMFGAPSPAFRLWKLPDLTYQDGTLADLGARRVWICPPGHPVPEGAAWVIPSESGDQNEREAALNSDQKAEAEKAAQAAGRPAWFAASRQTWEAVGLQWFPILIDLDAKGNVAGVRMGDAAP